MVNARIRLKARPVYSLSEHGCAISYAICEFAQLHALLYFFSIVLLVAVALLGVQQVLVYFGVIDALE